MTQADYQSNPVRKYRNRKTKWGYLFLIPWFLFFAVFTVYPFLYGIGVSFTNYDLKGMDFIGLQNFQAILKDPAFFHSVIATIGYAAIIIPLSLVISLWVANILMSHGPKTNAFAKAAIYLPAVTCQAALVIVWRFTLSPSSSLIAGLFKMLGLPMYSLFDSPMTAIPVLSLLIVLSSLGQPVILYSAAMNGIPVSYYEAAELDGARRSQQFFGITLPLLHSTTTFILITNTIGILQVFVVPYLMTSGGPQYKTSTLLLMIYKSAFQNGSFGYASAVGVVLFIVTAIIAALQFKMMQRDVIEY